jgi:hypothetical protein
MNALTIYQQKYLDVAGVLPWATKLHYTLWFTGSEKRHKTTERVLPALVKKGLMVTAKHGKRKIYATAEKLKIHIPKGAKEPVVRLQDPFHGLGISEIAVRMILSKPYGVAIGEKEFKKMNLGVVPDCGILNSTATLVEFQTIHSADQPGNLKRKIERYESAMPKIEQFFGKKVIVLFVYDIPDYRLRMMIEDICLENYYFTDYSSFVSVPYRKQLSTDIYIWGYDKQTYSLAKDG